MRYLLRINENSFICVCKNGYIITECICVYFIFMYLAERVVLYVYCSLTVKCFLESYPRLFEVVKILIYILNFQKRFEHFQEFSLIHQSKCLNTQRSLAVVATLFVFVLWYCDMYTGVLAVKWYWARRYLSVNCGYQYPSRKTAPVQKLLAVILQVLVSR